MIGLSSCTVDKSCRMARTHFPSTLILDVLKDLTGDQNFANFPNIREFNEGILRGRKVGKRITLKAVTEMSTYFYEEQDLFLAFLKSLTSQGIKYSVVSKVALDDFISKVNALLLEDSKIKIENYEVIQKWVPNKAEKEVFLNINVPGYIQDYFAEALDCLAYDLHRSSILFCTFALEASMRCKYAELVNENKAYALRFGSLIDWGIKNGLVEEDDFNKVNIDFIRRYRNDLAHFNMNKPGAELRISRGYARRMSSIIVHLVELFINNMFFISM